MSKLPDAMYSRTRLTSPLRLIGLTAVLLAVAATSGCISAKRKPVDAEPVVTPTETIETTPAPSEPLAPAQPAEPVTPSIPPTPEPEPEPLSDDADARQPDILTSWIVAKGEHLWGISSVAEVYGAPEQWPLLYKANLDQIADADLIYPGQVLRIPRDVSRRELDAAVEHARNRGAWAIGPVELSDKAYLKE